MINVQYGTDNFKDNDTLTLNVFNAPLITTFPFILENLKPIMVIGGVRELIIHGNMECLLQIRSIKPPAEQKHGRQILQVIIKTGNFFLYSPCYNIGGMTNPTLSLNIALDLEDCGGGGLCDGAYIEYSEDGVTWSRLGNVGTGTNWYNRNYNGNTLLECAELHKMACCNHSSANREFQLFDSELQLYRIHS